MYIHFLYDHFPSPPTAITPHLRWALMSFPWQAPALAHRRVKTRRGWPREGGEMLVALCGPPWMISSLVSREPKGDPPQCHFSPQEIAGPYKRPEN